MTTERDLFLEAIQRDASQSWLLETFGSPPYAFLHPGDPVPEYLWSTTAPSGESTRWRTTFTPEERYERPTPSYNQFAVQREGVRAGNILFIDRLGREYTHVSDNDTTLHLLNGAGLVGNGNALLTIDSLVESPSPGTKGTFRSRVQFPYSIGNHVLWMRVPKRNKRLATSGQDQWMRSLDETPIPDPESVLVLLHLSSHLLCSTTVTHVWNPDPQRATQTVYVEKFVIHGLASATELDHYGSVQAPHTTRKRKRPDN